ncbi:recombination regulator RecX [Rhodococcus opacus]|uniref:Regulatory protein RecX n=2 Tax=Rhodococcus opacus TaxID=37919 RepID=A0A1B1K4Z7_RHOOP|nr:MULTISPECIES: recombination regulator RecX [Rhodococcus]ELB93032.1 recombination regulator RecX [Rhodococcus wratislaviensis IFP 2016]NHU46521.1 recombination regulator RecX [Rhodococcus sp. A14]ANS27687.1 recombination regulator RecX [Rhodococcus opacus]MDI9939384.1 recombination regulator RecX [Rhodococcus sp. IEGM 1351]MDJ0418450.1 recombination regulator RecX [Rhodococcus opacus]
MRPTGEGGTETQAKDLCLRLLTDRARSRAELAERLAKKGYSPEIAERVLDRLTEVGLVNDADFAQQWVHSRHTYSGKGKRALALELRRKGIGQEDATEALAQIDSEDERARATELVEKKLRTVSADDRDRAVRRLVSMLARRGFPQGMAFEVVKEQLDRAGAETDGLFDET